MAEQVKLQVELQSNLEKVVNATKGVKLDKGQSERVEKHTKAAQLALETGDLKTFQKNFNSLVKIFKDAASETGKLSEEIKKMTSHQASLSQELNRLKDKKASLEGQLTKKGELRATAARQFASTHKDAQQVVKADGKVASRDEIIELQKALAEFLAKTGKKITEVTKKDLEEISTKDGATFGSRTSMFAAQRYVKAEAQHAQSLPTQIQDVQSEIDVKEEEYTNLSNEITRMSEAAEKGAEDITKLYTEISKLSDVTNNKITEEVNKGKSKGDQTPATMGTDLPTANLSGLQNQSTGLTKAFKQFTIYNMAIKGAKMALKEAIQTVKELDKYLTEQAMVTGKTREETYGLVKSYQDLAMQCGATTKEIAQVATEYMKQGKSTADALVLTEAAVKAAKVAGVSVSDSVNYLTTALNGFQLAAEDAMAVSDKFAAVAASSATDYDELAIALSKVASQANLAGMSMDYTTALLTKGLETTREAPETMGTALKTIIARMRELGDYGETLDDGMDINNVESQLKYVGIALRDSNGELRSTEDVLDELGKKWDTLDKNQQAAIAKALAGTRQQARLIAMMEDYERVTELQEISQRSAGATAAQAEIYLEGMEGAMNRVQVAWEKVVMTFTDSEVIIGIVDTFAEIIDYVAALLENPFFTTGVVTLVLATIVKTIGMKLQEQHIARETAKLENQQNLVNSKAKENELKALINNLKIKRAEFAINKDNYKMEIKKTAQLKKQALQAERKSIADDPNKSAKEKEAELKRIDDAIKATEDQEKAALEAADARDQQFADQISAAEQQLTIQEDLTRSLEGQSNTLAQTRNAWMGYLNSVKDCASGVVNFGKSIGTTIKNIATASKKATDAGRPASAAVIPIVGWIISLVLEGAALIGTIMTTVQGIMSAIEKYKKDNANSAENTADEINKISNEIYKLNERASKLKQVTSAFEEIDNKVIKTKEDIQEMNELLDSASDSLSSEREKTTDNKGNEKEVEGSQSQQEVYAGLYTDEDKYNYLKKIEAETEDEADLKRQELLAEAINLRESNEAEFYAMMDENTSNGKYLQAQSAIRATAYNAMYDYVDDLSKNTDNENLLKQTETLTQSLIEGMTAMEALDYAEHPEKLQDLVNKIQDVQMQIEDTNGKLQTVNATEIFMDEGKSIAERIKAFEEIAKTLEHDKVALEAFTKQYSDWAELADTSKWSLSARQFISDTNMSVDEINKMFAGYKTLQKEGVSITQEVYESKMRGVLGELNTDLSNLDEILMKNFNDILTDEENFAEQWDLLLQQVVNSLSVSMLDMGQNIEKFKNSINNFYETALNWAEMSDSDKMSFISENAAMFEGEGAKLLDAFESGNYERIAAALDPAMEERRARELEAVERTLNAENKKENKNVAYIKMLEEYKEYLENKEDLYQASLEVRLDQEKKQIDEYKTLLEKEQEALVESLEKRKEAYEKYFDEIDQNQEDEDYEAESERLVSNISKLASSSDASAKKQTAELEQELQELEKERLQTLKERAREAILENMDNEIEEINDKFDKLLDSNQALLAAMQGDLENPTEFLAEMISNKFADGATKLELEDYVNNLESIYGNTLEGVDWDAIKEEVVEQLFLNVNGQDVTLNEIDERAVYEAVKKALQAIGKR